MKSLSLRYLLLPTVLLLLSSIRRIISFSFTKTTTTTTKRNIQSNIHSGLKTFQLQKSSPRSLFVKLESSSSSSSQDEETQQSVATTSTDFVPERTIQTPELTPEDSTLIDEILAKSNPNTLSAVILQYLPRMSPSLILSIRNASSSSSSNDVNPDDDNDNGETCDERLLTLKDPLVNILDDQLSSAKDLLKSLLTCGEIRKLDGAIGRAAKEGRLDMAFFTVLNMNIADAIRAGAADAAAESSSSSSSAIISNEELTTNDDDDDDDESSSSPPMEANRSAILQHISTRCQEEIEKRIDPGVALLNKLLRTTISSIRDNQLRHYLAPLNDDDENDESNKIKTPDGVTLSLGKRPALVPPRALIGAMESAVERIRLVERSGGTDRVTAANLVEEVRQVAIDARRVIYEVYGEGSEELSGFESGLQPVFRPGTEL